MQLESIQEVATHYGELRAAILNKLFELPAEARKVDISMNSSVKERVGKDALNKVQIAHGEQLARDTIDAAKAKFIELELEEAEAIEALAREAEAVLTPEVVSPESVIQSATLTEDQLIAASDVARNFGDDGADTCLILLQAAIERDLDQAAAHIVGFSEEWQNAYNIIAEAGQRPDIDEDEFANRFDTLVPDSAVSFLSGGESELNRLGRIRS